MIIEYKNGIVSDDNYNSTIKELNSLKCSTNLDGTNSCTNKTHLDLGITSLGWDTIVDRKSNKIEITFNNPSGIGKKASKSDMDIVLSSYKNTGFKCK